MTPRPFFLLENLEVLKQDKVQENFGLRPGFCMLLG